MVQVSMSSNSKHTSKAAAALLCCCAWPEVPVTLTWKGSNKWIFVGHWPASLSKQWASCSAGEPVSRNREERKSQEDTWLPTMTSACQSAGAHACTHTYTHNNTLHICVNFKQWNNKWIDDCRNELSNNVSKENTSVTHSNIKVSSYIVCQSSN